MSESEAGIEAFVADVDGTDAIETLRDALSAVLDRLVATGRGPHHLAEMTWEAGDPPAFHPSRHAVDLVYREVFGGFRPPIRLQTKQGAGLTIRARLTPPGTSVGAVGAHADLAALARQYSPRVQTDVNALFRRWRRDGDAFRAGETGLDLAYGPGRFETLDLYRPTGSSTAPHPVWVFVHGGYWQASDKAQHAQFARGMREAGFAVAMPNYGLAPETPLETSLGQIVSSLNFLVQEATGLGLDASQLHIAGHSAGGHLAAMALCASDAPPIRSALLLSGLYDLEPLSRLPVARLLGLGDGDRVSRLSPMRKPRPSVERIAVAVGRDESRAFQQQTADLAAAWLCAEPTTSDGNHFEMLDGLNGGALLDLARETALM